MEQSCPWVGLTHGLGWVEIFQLLVGWVHYRKILKLWNDYVNAFKARLDKIWLHEAVKFISCIGLGPNFRTSSRLGWVSQLMGWVGSGHTKWTHGQLWNGDIDRQWRESGSTALSSKCEQCHVVSWRRKLNTDLLTSLPLGGRALRWAYLFVCQSASTSPNWMSNVYQAFFMYHAYHHHHHHFIWIRQHGPYTNTQRHTYMYIQTDRIGKKNNKTQ